jgi:hypothetical protein
MKQFHSQAECFTIAVITALPIERSDSVAVLDEGDDDKYVFSCTINHLPAGQIAANSSEEGRWGGMVKSFKLYRDYSLNKLPIIFVL